jgi:hypothetical protein
MSDSLVVKGTRCVVAISRTKALDSLYGASDGCVALQKRITNVDQ